MSRDGSRAPAPGLATLAVGERDQVARTTRLATETLGADLVSMALYGSAMTTGLRPDSSDIDLLVVSARRLGPADRRRLVAGLLELSGRSFERAGGLRALELTVLAMPEILPWRFPPRFELQYGEWLRRDLVAGRAVGGPGVNADVAILIETVRAAAETLAGAPVGEALPVVPWADVVAAMGHDVDEVLPGIRDNTDTTNGLLTLARIISTATTRRILSKGEAADLVLASWSDRRVDLAPLRRARDEYGSGRYLRWGTDASDAAIRVGEALAIEARRRLAAT